jgi:membrane-associated phospholipid phosphatase
MLVFWVQAARHNQRGVRLRIITTMVGSATTILLALLAGALINSPPPVYRRGLTYLSPSYIDPNPSPSSFLSLSTVLYSSVAAGISSIHRIMGWFLWVALLLLVSLPRMYVGGHYFSDVVAGLVLALLGRGMAGDAHETALLARMEAALACSRRWMTDDRHRAFCLHRDSSSCRGVP